MISALFIVRSFSKWFRICVWWLDNNSYGILRKTVFVNRTFAQSWTSPFKIIVKPLQNCIHRVTDITSTGKYLENSLNFVQMWYNIVSRICINRNRRYDPEIIKRRVGCLLLGPSTAEFASRWEKRHFIRHCIFCIYYLNTHIMFVHCIFNSYPLEFSKGVLFTNFQTGIFLVRQFLRLMGRFGARKPVLPHQLYGYCYSKWPS